MNKILLSLLLLLSLMSISCKGEEKTNVISSKSENTAAISAKAAATDETKPSYQLSTHILDLSKGEPAAGVLISLYKIKDQNSGWELIEENKTDMNGRVGDFLPISGGNTNNEGIYKLKFETKPYFESQNLKSIYPFIEIVFEIKGNGHYHIPITMSANGYSTYRGN